MSEINQEDLKVAQDVVSGIKEKNLTISQLEMVGDLIEAEIEDKINPPAKE